MRRTVLRHLGRLMRNSAILSMFEELSQFNGVEIIDLTPFICNEDTGCSAMVDGKFIYGNDDHLNYLGGKLLGQK